MSLTRLASLIRKEFIEIAGDPRSLYIVIAIPVVQLFLLGYTATTDVRNVPLAVLDQSRSPASRSLLDAYRAADYFRLAGQSYSTGITFARIERRGLGGAVQPALDVRPQVWYNPDLVSAYFMVPALIGMILQLITSMLTATAIVRERERGR